MTIMYVSLNTYKYKIIIQFKFLNHPTCINQFGLYSENNNYMIEREPLIPFNEGRLIFIFGHCNQTFLLIV